MWIRFNSPPPRPPSRRLSTFQKLDSTSKCSTPEIWFLTFPTNAANFCGVRFLSPRSFSQLYSSILKTAGEKFHISIHFGLVVLPRTVPERFWTVLLPSFSSNVLFAVVQPIFDASHVFLIGSRRLGSCLRSLLIRRMLFLFSLPHCSTQDVVEH